MARKPNLRQIIDGMLDTHAPLIRLAFLESIADVRSQVTLKAVVEALERGDIGGALDALNLERSAFSRVENAIAAAYNAGGTAMVGNLPTLRSMAGAKVVVRFDARNPRAEAWLSDHSSRLVRDIIEDARNDLRGVLTDAMSRGQNPNRTALDIVGRINRASGKREGGLLGLSGPQSRFVASARQELISGDPTALRNYLTRNQRDRRFDKAVMKAIADGKPMDMASIDKAIGRYSDRLLALRGKMIGRTESLSSLNAAGHEAFRQGLDKTNYGPEQVTRTWDSAGDGKVRHTHAAMDGQVVRGLDTPFVSPSGAMMLHPGDTSLGAGAAEIIACRCIQRIEIDFFNGRA